MDREINKPSWRLSATMVTVGLLSCSAAADTLKTSHSLTLEYGQSSRAVGERKDAAQLFYVPAVTYQHDSNWAFIGDAYIRTGRQLSSAVGDIQGVSNIDAPELAKVGQAYLRYQTDDFWVKFGRQDENSDFALSSVAGEFINSSMGYSPSLNGLESYPDATWMLSAQVKLNDQWVANASQSADRTVLEMHWRVHTQHHLKVGYWYHNDLRDWGGDGSAHHPYAILDSHWNSDWSSFIQYAPASSSTGEITQHIGAGVRAKLPWRGFGTQADAQSLGLAATRAKVRDAAAETAYELYWRLPLQQQVSLKPSIQYIDQPSGDPERAGAWVGILRLAMNW